MVINKEEMDRRLLAAKNLARFARDLDPAVESVSQSKEEISPLPTAKRENNPRSENKEARIVAGALYRSGQLSAKEAAKEMGLTPNQVIGAAHSKDTDVQTRMESNINRAREMALDKMIDALGLLDNERMQDCSVRDIASVAEKMHRIASGSRESGPREDSVKLIIYAPEQKKMNDFKVIDVGD